LPDIVAINVHYVTWLDVVRRKDDAELSGCGVVSSVGSSDCESVEIRETRLTCDVAQLYKQKKL